MTLPLARPTRLPRGLEKWDLVEILDWGRRQAAKKPWNDLERLLRVLQLTYGISRAEALARARLEYPNLAKEATMNVIIDNEEIELEPERFLGEHLDAIATRLVEAGLAKDYRTGRDLARERWPELARAYDLSQVIEGPQVEYRPPEGEQLIRDLKTRFERYPGVSTATTLRELVGRINEGVIAEADRLGRDKRQAWQEALLNDSDLKRAVLLS